MNRELPVIRACYGLTLDLSRRVDKFPRHQRASLGGELTDRCRGVLARLIEAKYAAPEGKAHFLAEANVQLELLRFGLRLACDLKSLPVAGHGHVLGLAQDVGAQIGGWLKAVRQQAPAP